MAPRKQGAQTRHPPRPQPGPVNVADAHEKISRRFPKVLAALAQ